MAKRKERQWWKNSDEMIRNAFILKEGVRMESENDVI